MYLLAIDIGTSSCKLSVFKKDGTHVASCSRAYPLYTPAPGFVEQDANEWWDAVCSACRELLEKNSIPADKIDAIGIDGQSWSAIPIDAQGKVLRKTPIWMDTRAKDTCKKYEERIGAENIFRVAGNPFSPSYTLPKILYFMEHEPELVENTSLFLQANSFIAYRLTGEIAQDLSMSYGYHNFDQHTLKYDDGLTEAFGIDKRFLLPMVPCHQVIGKVTKEAAAITGLKEGTPVVPGGLDAACATLGVGVVNPGQTQEQGGQAGGMSICVDKPLDHPALILSPHVVPGQWLLQGGTVAGGASMNWFSQQFGAVAGDHIQLGGKDLFIKLSQEAESSRPGAGGVIYLPYLNGERSPIWDPTARGSFFGLQFSTTHADLVRATMEGVAYSLQHNLALAKSVGAEVSELRATGGSANSVIWTQIKADVTGIPMVVPSADTAATCGAAILAGMGVGIYESAQSAAEQIVKVRRTQEPDPSKAEVYGRYFDLYCRLYESTKDIMGSIHEIEFSRTEA